MTISKPMDQDPPIAPPRSRPCPHCGKPSVMRHQPFCSKRCADIDLGKWLNGDYRIPAEEQDDEGIEDEFG